MPSSPWRNSPSNHHLPARAAALHQQEGNLLFVSGCFRDYGSKTGTAMADFFRDLFYAGGGILKFQPQAGHCVTCGASYPGPLRSSVSECGKKACPDSLPGRPKSKTNEQWSRGISGISATRLIINWTCRNYTSQKRAAPCICQTLSFTDAMLNIRL